MFGQDDVSVEITQVQGGTVLVEIRTPVGMIEIMGDVARIGRVLYVTGTHIAGLHAGALGHLGLNVIGR